MEKNSENHLICIETTYFTLFYSKEDSSIVNQIVTIADEMYERVTKQFNLECLHTPYRLFLCKDTESFRYHAHKNEEDYEEWMVGNVDPIHHEICILSPRVVQNSDMEYMYRVLRHEVVHSVFSQLALPEKVSIVLSEGIAVALAEQINLLTLRMGIVPTIHDLEDEEYFYANYGYDFSGAYILHFLRRYGTERLKLVYEGKEDFKSYIDENFEKEAIKNILG